MDYKLPQFAKTVKVDVSAAIADALHEMRQNTSKFAVLTEEGRPKSLVTEEQLVGLSLNEEKSLAAMADLLPPLLIVDEPEDRHVDADEVLNTLNQLVTIHAPGYLTYDGNGQIQVLARSSLAEVLPTSYILSLGVSERRTVTAADGGKTYICRKCIPPRRRRPRTEGAPDCDVPGHGQMVVDQ